jgi:hypothetical protein
LSLNAIFEIIEIYGMAAISKHSAAPDELDGKRTKLGMFAALVSPALL